MAFAFVLPKGSNRESSSRLPSEGEAVGPAVVSQLLVQICTELTALPWKLLERVWPLEFIDFIELTSARWKCKILS